MKIRNVGNADRIARVILGVGLLSLVFLGPQTAWGWIGLVPLVTAVMGWCPAYSLLGVKTCKTESGTTATDASTNTAA